jgi:hypothetical protein
MVQTMFGGGRGKFTPIVLDRHVQPLCLGLIVFPGQ